MRDYVLHESLSRQAYGRLTVIVRMVRNWRMRNDLKRLQAMDDWMLKDIGLTRDELRRLSRMPLTADLDWERDCRSPISR